MKPLHQESLLLRLCLLTIAWLLIQLLLLPMTQQQNDLVLQYSSLGLMGLITIITGYDSYRVFRHTKASCCVAIDLLTLALAGILLFLI